jgi:monoamine oxidase
VPGVFLAGAWCDTGWPATMEGAVRSGNDAAAAALGLWIGRGARSRQPERIES